MIYSSKKYKYVIVDSQLNDVFDLKRLMDKYTNYSCVGVANSREEALNLIIDQLPQLVFFEPKIVGSGTIKSSFSIIPEVYQYLNSLPQFIAMHASTSYSYEAIKNGVFDYMLKPLDYFDLKKALIRFENKQPDGSSICLKSFTEFRFLLAEDIVYLKADNNTTDFYLKDGSMVTSFKTLKYFERDLPNIFSRIHRSYIINVKYITKIHFSKFQCSLKYTNKLVPFSRSVKSRMLDIKNLWLNGDFEGFSQQIKFT